MVFSPLCEKYCQVLFFNAIEVWKVWGKTTNQVFHDGDYPFIRNNEQGSMEDYLDAIEYLVSREKYNPFARRNEHGEGNKEWAKKTSQFADILWALTNEVFGLHKKILKGDDRLEFSWDDVTENLLNLSKEKLQNKIDTYNTYFLNAEGGSNLELTYRNKSLASAVEKVIEGKNLTDIIGLRVSTEGIKKSTFELIQEKVIIPWFQEFSTDIQLHPEHYGLEKGEQLRLGKIQIDNKNVLDKQKMEALIFRLKTAGIKTEKRKKAPSNYIEEEEWIHKLKDVYPEDVANKLRFDTFLEFYRLFSGGKKRGSNGDYKDFKFLIEVEVLDQQREIEDKKLIKVKDKKPIEVQFYDHHNEKDLAKTLFRDMERTGNTRSNLTFDFSLEEFRKNSEEKIKDDARKVRGKSSHFQIINF